MEPILKKTGVDDVVDRNEAHPLMMGHERSNDGGFLIFGEPFRCVVDRFVKSKTRQQFVGDETFDILKRRCWIHHGREKSRIR